MSNKYKVRDKRNRGWFYMDNEYLNGLGKHLGVTGIAIYVSLCRHADNEQKCFPAQETIAEELGCSVATIKRYLRLLTKHNVIATERVKKGRKWAHNVYYLLDKSEWIYPEKVSRVTDKEPHPSDKCLLCNETITQACHIKPRREGGGNGKDNIVYLCPNHHWKFDNEGLSKKQLESIEKYHGSQIALNVHSSLSTGSQLTEYLYHGSQRATKDTNKKKTNELDPYSESDDFMSFWEIYPNKKDKKKARAKWSKLKQTVKDQIMADIPNRIQNDDNWKRGYIPMPTTYINGERWEDEITKSKNSTPMGYIG